MDIDAGNKAVELMKDSVRATYRPEVIGDLGGFGGLFALGNKYQDPVLVSGTDGVGTKLKIAFMMDRHDTIGQDAVAMCVNDILVQGAEPLFFLDYIATAKVESQKIADIVKGVANACKESGCALIGGETAEMAGFYAKDEYDIAGFSVGVVERSKMITGEKVKAGDVLLGLPSTGVHSNGFSLVRKICFEAQGFSVDTYIPEFGKTLGEELLTPTRLYPRTILPMIKIRPPRHGPHHRGRLLRQHSPDPAGRLRCGSPCRRLGSARRVQEAPGMGQCAGEGNVPDLQYGCGDGTGGGSV